VKNGSYVDYLFGVATGWLGWPPETAWHTPIPQLMMALNARLDWMNLNRSTPTGRPAPAQAKKASVADRLKAFMRGRGEA
jgi:hypothetical protein